MMKFFAETISISGMRTHPIYSRMMNGREAVKIAKVCSSIGALMTNHRGIAITQFKNTEINR